MVLSDEVEKLEDSLLPEHRKLGWIVYRTTYGDDEQWARCIDLFQQLVRKFPLMDEGNTEHIQKYLDFPVRDDERTYNNSTSANLRTYFKTWRSSDEAFAEQQMDHSQQELLWRNLSYQYFIQIGAESMRSILDATDGIIKHSRAWVDLVQVEWPKSESGAKSGAEEEDFGDDETYSPIEAMTTYDLGFQRVPVDELYPTCWLDKEYIPEKWYVRPPELTYVFTQ